MPEPESFISLKADCSRCASLCCVVFAFDRSESFAIDKAAGEVCPNLGALGKCTVFENREELGFPGCISYDCHGAGQVITQTVFRGLSWRDDARLAPRMGAALSVLRRLHEQLLLLQTAERLPLAPGERDRLSELRRGLLPHGDWTEADLAAYPVDKSIREVRSFLTGLRHHVGSSASARN
ncbi:MAG: hypothetical protein Tsb0019_03570 [Roseibium sp.]